METILTILAPPVLGAFIGYLTNYVAIRMLFRPLRPWRLLGLQLPMTPGVIPKKRHQLAGNIGKMVGGHLLTSEDVRKALTEEGFQRELEELIQNRFATLMQKELGPIATLVPERFRGYFDMGVKILRWRFTKHLHNYIDSAPFAEAIARAVETQVDEFLARDLGRYLSAPTRDRLATGVQSAAERLFASSWLENWVQEYVRNQYETLLKEEKALTDLLPASFVQLILDRLEGETPQLLQKIAKRLEEPLVQDRIARAVGKSVNNFLGSLGPLAAMVGNFLDPEKIDEKIRGYLAEKSDDLSRWLFDETVQRKVAELLREKVHQFLSTPIATLLKDVKPERVEKIRDGFSTQLIALLRKPETAGLLGTLCREGLEKQTGRPLAEILTDLAGADGLTQGKQWTVQELVTILRSEETRKILDNLLTELVERRILAQPIGSLADFLPREVQEGISDFLLQQISDLLVREVPGLVDSLNIQQVVARKVDSLDLLRLEGLLLGIMQEQFKYINIFGAILGFFIGGLNLLLFLFL